MRRFSQFLTFLLIGLAFSTADITVSSADEAVPLRLEKKIPLGDVKGRIDHIAVDLAQQRLFLAELGNNSVAIVDLKASKTTGRIRGLPEPQGVGYIPSTDTLYVTSAGDGSVRLFQLRGLKEVDRIELGDDADNVRVDNAGERVFVGYGQGALAVIDARAKRKIAEVTLDGHPESFQLENGGSRVFINVPDAHVIEVGDREHGEVIARWPTGPLSGNFAMTLDDALQEIMVVFRNPATLAAFSMKDGTAIASATTCRDSDDVFLDTQRQRIYVTCGEGYLDAFALDGGSFRRIAHLPTAPGARTSLFVPELDRLFLAVRATDREKAAIWVYQPVP